MDTTAPAPTSPLAARFAFAALPAKKKLLAGGGAAALVALILASTMWSRQPDMRVLFANLSDRDGGAVIAALSQMNVPYRHADGGGAILIPADKVHDVRLKLASQGLPKGGTVGFELLENQKFGTTQFQERLNFQRGLEGELARSIQALAAVASARVHLAIPNQTAFLREQQKPSASVLLQLHPGRALDRAQVAGIVHLVASSVPELSPKQVSVVDQTGSLLSMDGGDAAGGLDASQIEYQRRIERTLAQRITEIIEPLVGRDNVRAQVTADLDFSQSEQTAEQYRPNQGDQPAAVRSQQTSEQTGPGQGGPQGVPGAMSNQPQPPASAPINGPAQPPAAAGQAAAGTSGPTRRDAVTNFEVDKTVRVTRSAVGTIRRLNAAVVVNHRREVDKNGKVTNVALSPEQIEQMNALVREAIGFSKERGDSINVVNAPFTQVEQDRPEDLPFWKDPDLMPTIRDLGVQAVIALLALALIFGVIRPALKPPMPPKAEGEDTDEDGAPRLAATVADDVALPAPDAAPALEAPPPTAAELALKLARDNPATVANVVRDWIAAGA